VSDENNYVLTTETGVPIKAWTKGMTLEDQARKQLLNVAQLPFIFKWVAAVTPLRFATLHLHQVGTGLSPASCRTCAAYNEKGGGPGRPASLLSPRGEAGQSDGGRLAGRVLACLYNPEILKKVPEKPKKVAKITVEISACRPVPHRCHTPHT
jgi:hypothetical protein